MQGEDEVLFPINKPCAPWHCMLGHDFQRDEFIWVGSHCNLSKHRTEPQKGEKKTRHRTNYDHVYEGENLREEIQNIDEIK